MDTKLKGTVSSHARPVSVACALLVTLLVFLFHMQFSKSNYLLSDSADYVRAARSPFLHTYLNTDSASPVQLLAMRKDPGFSSHPWDYLYFHGDNAAIRHFHAPFSFYTMHAVSLASSSDRNQRLLTSVVTAATCGVIVIDLSLFGVPLAVAGLLALVAGIQSRYTEISVDPSPHSWYMLFAVLFLFTFASYLGNRRFRTLAISAVMLAFAFATLEFSLELVASIPLALALLWLVNRNAFGDIRALAISFLKAFPVFCLTTFILWPGGWFRGGYLESYGVTGATVLLKNKAAFGDRLTVAGLYTKFFSGHEALLILVAFLLVGLIISFVQHKLSIATIVFVSYTAVASALGVADHFRLDTYVSEALLYLLITVALLFKDIVSGMSVSSRRISTAAALIVLVVVGAQEWSRRQSLILYKPWLKPILAGVSADVPSGSTILVNDNLEAYSTYLPKYNYEPTVSEFDVTPRNATRTKAIHFFLLNDDAPPIPKAKLVQSFPTNIPGRHVRLYIKE